MPPITPEQYGELSVRYEKLVRELEEKLLADIARRIADAGAVTDTAEWQIRRLREMGYATDYIKEQLAEFTQKSDEEIEQLFFDAAQVSDEFYGEVYAAAGKPFVPFENNPYMQQVVSAGMEQTKGELRNFTQSMGFSVKGLDGQMKFKPAAKAYQAALDLAQAEVASGTFDYNTAVRNAVKTLTDSGLRYVDYATGHVNHADVAARRAILTGVSQMAGKIAEHNMAELDTDLVEVSAHAGARPDHAVWQGKVYRWKRGNKNEKVLTNEVNGDTMKNEREYRTFGLNFISHRDDLYRFIDKIKPLDNCEDVVFHADRESFLILDPETQDIVERVTPQKLSELLKNSENYQQGKNVRLISCQAAYGDNSLAQQLADLLNVEVTAPTEILAIANDGETFISDNQVLMDMWENGENVTQTGEWKTFKPKR